MRLGRYVEAQLWLLTAAALAVTRSSRAPKEGLLGMHFDDETGEELFKLAARNSLITELHKLDDSPDTIVVLIADKNDSGPHEPLVVYQTGVSTSQRTALNFLFARTGPRAARAG